MPGMLRCLISGSLVGVFAGGLIGAVGFAVYMAATSWGDDYAEPVVIFGAIVGALLGLAVGLVTSFLTYKPTWPA